MPPVPITVQFASRCVSFNLEVRKVELGGKSSTDFGSGMPSVYAVFFGPENRAVTLKLLQYSVLMFVAPLATYYATLHAVFGGDVKQVGWCGLAAVVVANIVIAAYVVMAWNEELEDDHKKDAGGKKKKDGFRVD